MFHPHNLPFVYGERQLFQICSWSRPLKRLCSCATRWRGRLWPNLCTKCSMRVSEDIGFVPTEIRLVRHSYAHMQSYTCLTPGIDRLQVVTTASILHMGHMCLFVFCHTHIINFVHLHLYYRTCSKHKTKTWDVPGFYTFQVVQDFFHQL